MAPLYTRFQSMLPLLALRMATKKHNTNNNTRFISYKSLQILHARLYTFSYAIKHTEMDIIERMLPQNGLPSERHPACDCIPSEVMRLLKQGSCSTTEDHNVAIMVGTKIPLSERTDQCGRRMSVRFDDCVFGKQSVQVPTE